MTSTATTIIAVDSMTKLNVEATIEAIGVDGCHGDTGAASVDASIVIGGGTPFNVTAWYIDECGRPNAASGTLQWHGSDLHQMMSDPESFDAACLAIATARDSIKAASELSDLYGEDGWDDDNLVEYLTGDYADKYSDMLIDAIVEAISMALAA